MVALAALVSILLAGSLVYCILVVVASVRYRSVRPPEQTTVPPISVLIPLCGHDEGLEDNLRSYFVQDYPEYEVVFAVHHASDPAAAVAQAMMHEYAGKTRSQLVVTGESAIPNAKAHSLNRLVREAHYELLVMCD